MSKNFDLIAKKIVKDKLTCFFISPHLDDAVLSCGGLILYLVGKKIPVSVINVFSEGDNGPYTISAKVHLRLTGYRNAKKLYEKRRSEDKSVLNKIGANKIYLGFIEALYRKKNFHGSLFLLGKIFPELIHIYPSYKLNILRGEPDNEELLEKEMAKRLKFRTGNLERNMIFCPVGMGKHVDHILVRDVCANNFKKVIYWQDFPYRQKYGQIEKFVKVNKLEKYEYDKNIDEKNKLVLGYKSQVKNLLKKHFESNKEKFFINKEFLLSKKS